MSRAVLDEMLCLPSELSGALNRALVALRRLRNNERFSETATTRQALDEFRTATDPFVGWLDRETEEGNGLMTSQARLIAAYRKDCMKAERPLMTAQAFGRTLRLNRPQVVKAQRPIGGKTTWVYLGIDLLNGSS